MPTPTLASRPPLTRVATMIFNTPLLVMPEKLDVILHALGPRLGTDITLDDVIRANPNGLSDDQVRRLLAYDDEEDDPMSVGSGNGKPYKMTDTGVAVIPIRGTLLKRGSWMSSLSGFSSYDQLKRTVDAAMADTSVKGVLFDVDSPGGSTHGCFELADHLYSLRGQKPMFAAANDLAASGAYALASAADKLYVTRTGAVGSIGVYCCHLDVSKADKELGVKYSYVFAGAKKVEGNPHQPLSDSARSDLQAEVDRQYGMFVETVARNRRISSKAVMGTEAGVFSGDAATELLADEIGTFSDALAGLEAKIQSSSPKNSTGTAKLYPSVGTKREADPMPEATTQPTEQKPEKVASVFKFVVEGKEVLIASDVPGFTCTLNGKTYNAAELEAAVLSGEVSPVPPVPAATAPPTPTPVPAPVAQGADEEEDDEDFDEPDPDDESDDISGKAKPPMPTEKTTQTESKVTEISTANDASKEIAQLCVMAGATDRLPGYLSSGKSVAEVREELYKLRSEEAVSEKTKTTSSHTGGVNVTAYDQLMGKAQALSAASGGKMSLPAAIDHVARTEPDLYRAYKEERSDAAAGGAGARRKHVEAMGSRFKAIGLTSTPTPAGLTTADSRAVTA